MWIKIAAISSFVSILVLVVVLNTTEPTNIGPVGVLAVFALIYIAFVGIFVLLIKALSYIFAKIPRLLGTKKYEQLSDKKIYYYGSVVASTPVLLIGMQSIDKLGIYDVALVLLFVSMACFYISKRSN